MTLSPARRRPPAGGYARGEETRLRIIHAALDLFGAEGYARASTREIAARAGVNPPALQYYFDSKEGLYLACAEHMVERGRELFGPVLSEARRRLAADGDVEDLIEGVCLIHARSAELLLMASELDVWARFMAWEQIDSAGAPAIACEVMERGLKRKIREVLHALIGRILGRSPDDPEVHIRALTLGGQVSVFRLSGVGRATYPEWAVLDEAAVARIKSVVRSQTQAALRAAATETGRSL